VSTNLDADSLLGLRVGYRGLALGSVSAVLVDREGVVLGLEVRSSFRPDPLFLPEPAAVIRDGAIEATPLVLLSSQQVAFYAERGARRITAPTEVSHAAVRG
jgi:hypothetical protein